MTSLSVVHVVGRVDIPASGPSYTVPRLCSALAKQRCEVSVHSMGLPPANWPYTFPLHIHPKLSIFDRFWISSRLRRQLCEAARIVDIIHNHGLWLVSNEYAVKAVRGTKCKLVSSPRGAASRYSLGRSKFPKSIMWKLGHHRVLSAAALVHVTSEGEHQEVRELGIKTPIAIIPNGIDLPASLANVPTESGGKKCLLFMSRIDHKKGLDLLLEAWKQLQHDAPDWELVIAGPDDHGYLKQIQELIRRLDLDRVKLIGPVEGDQKTKLLCGASLFVLPSRSENFGVVVGEALACEVPVVVTKNTPWAGVENRTCGWWINGDTPSLYSALKGAVSLSSDELHAMGQRGREWMASDFGWEEIGRKMLLAYQWILHGGTAPDFVRVD